MQHQSNLEIVGYGLLEGRSQPALEFCSQFVIRCVELIAFATASLLSQIAEILWLESLIQFAAKRNTKLNPTFSNRDNFVDRERSFSISTYETSSLWDE